MFVPTSLVPHARPSATTALAVVLAVAAMMVFAAAGAEMLAASTDTVLASREVAAPTGAAGTPGGGVISASGATLSTAADAAGLSAADLGRIGTVPALVLLVIANALAFARRQPARRRTLAEERLQILRALSS